MTEDRQAQKVADWPIQRRTDRRVLSGLAAGIADALDIDAVYVRAAFILLTLAGGTGAVAYGLGWVLTADRASASPLPPAVTASRSEAMRALGFQLILVGIVAIFILMGLALDPSIMWPAGLVTLGVANMWALGNTQQRQWLQGIIPGTDGPSRSSRGETLVRLGIGGALVAGGVTLALTSSVAFREAGSVVLAVSITLIGLMLVLGPWVWRLWRQLSAERHERIRSEEKTEIAAHLHDSVLQTLALIQANADPQQQAVLARIQERELRSWLFDDAGPTDATLKALMDAAASDVERTHQIAVEAVTVGDFSISPDVVALVAATREALVNAARHSGQRAVSLFTEVDDRTIEVFVTDHGAGFSLDDVGAERQGIAESIRGRMQRHGGSATITTAPGQGTEVHLTLPVRTTNQGSTP